MPYAKYRRRAKSRRPVYKSKILLNIQNENEDVIPAEHTARDLGRFNFGKKRDREDLNSVLDILPFREKALKEAINGIRRIQRDYNKLTLTSEQIFALASTDVFVEKAQHVLTRRSWFLSFAGIACTLIIFTILSVAICFIYRQIKEGIPVEISGSILTPASTQALIFKIFQSIALSAFVLISLKWLFSLSRSFFHESLALLERRHALRFGRLYVYVKKGIVDDKDLIEAFQWNKETRTSFLDMKPEILAETLFHRFIDNIGKLPPEAIKAIVEASRAARGKSPE